jgi:hypothetical protein
MQFISLLLIQYMLYYSSSESSSLTDHSSCLPSGILEITLIQVNHLKFTLAATILNSLLDSQLMAAKYLLGGAPIGLIEQREG